MKAFAKGLALLALVVVLGAGVALFVKENLMSLESVRVQLAKNSEQTHLFERIQKDLDKQFVQYKGQPLYDVSLTEMMTLIEKDRRVATASLRRTFPNQITVEISPRRPLALLLGLDGNFHPVASDASLLPSLSVNASSDLPVLRGLSFFKSRGDRMKIVEILDALPLKGEFSQATISEIRMNRVKEVTLFLSESGQRVLIGKSLDKGQVERVEQVLKYLRSRSIKGRVIDARFSKKVVVRVRNAS